MPAKPTGGMMDNVPDLDSLPDMRRWIADLEYRKSILGDPADIAMMTVWIAHVRAEYELDLATACDTLTDDGCSRTWGGGMPEGGIMSTTLSNADRRIFYAQAFDASRDTMHLQEMVTERLVVGRDGIAFDGTLHVVTRGDSIQYAGARLPDGADPNAYYLVSRRVSGWNSFNDNRIIGEDRYRDGRVRIRQIVMDWDEVERLKPSNAQGDSVKPPRI